MTEPVVPVVEPSKAKTWVAVVGGLLTLIIPAITPVVTGLNEPWPAVFGAVVAILTAVGVYRAPYTPADTTIVANSDIPAINAGAVIVPEKELVNGKVPEEQLPAYIPPPPQDSSGGYKNPWK